MEEVREEINRQLMDALESVEKNQNINVKIQLLLEVANIYRTTNA